MEINRTKALLPKIIIHDTARSMDPDDIVNGLIRQKSELRLTQEDKALIKPIFMRGPKELKTVQWICTVHPVLYKKIIKRIVFIGLNRCKISEYTDVTQ